MCEEGIATITTKTGDTGFSSPRAHIRVLKSSLIFELLGTLDELNSFIGLSAAYTTERIKEQLVEIQGVLMDMSGSISLNREYSKKVSSFTVTLEKWSFDLEKEVPELNSFILPGGHVSAAHLHCTRTICRRCERVACACVHSQESKEENVVQIPEKSEVVCQLLNRLSDYLFIAARYQNFVNKEEDVKWTPKK